MTPQTITHIVFPFDFSVQGCQTAPYVRALAERYGAKVTLFSVVPPVWDMGGIAAGAAGPLTGEDLDGWIRDLTARLDKALVNELAGVPVQRVVASGDPAYTISDFAHGAGADLIMIPTHGTGRFRSLLLGSVTAKVLHDARCAVWTAAHAETQHASVLPRRIVVALDGSPANAALLTSAAAFAAKVGASLECLHVVSPVSDWLVLERERNLQDHVRDRAYEKVSAVMARAGVEAPLRVAVGEVVAVVAEEARQAAADLIMIGRGSLQATLGRLRTHAYGIIQRAPCPVLSL